MSAATSLRNRIARSAQAWARRRQGTDPSPLTLARQRVYILPTRQGLVFAILLLGMLLGAMNYNNNLGFAVTFLLAGVGLVTMYHCNRNLTGLRLQRGPCEPVFAGEVARPTIVAEDVSGKPRPGLSLMLERELHAQSDLGPGERAEMTITLPTLRRGLVRVERFSISSTFPLGLFRAWAWVHMPLECIVFPRPADLAPAPPASLTDIGGAQHAGRGDDDFAGLRDYRPGDPPRHVAWKAFARGQELLVRQYAGTSVVNHVFDLEAVPAPELEERLSVLCRWILDAHQAGEAFGLKMPGTRIEPALGVPHLERCLRRLALFAPGRS